MERPVAPVPGRCGMTPNPSNPTQTEDWVMVPADPNEAMLRAARDVPLNRHPGFSDFGSIYRAMLSAAPTISPRGSEDRETALREALDAYDTASAIARMTETRDAVRKQAEARTRLFALAALSSAPVSGGGEGKQGLMADPSEHDLVCGDAREGARAAPGEEGQS